MKDNYFNRRLILKVIIDWVVWTAITLFAFYLRLEDKMFTNINEIALVFYIVTPIKLLIIVLNGHYKISWRYTSFQDFRTPIMSIIYMSLIYYSIYIALPGKVFLPRAVPVIDAVLTFIAFFMIRMAAQFVETRKKNNYSNEQKKIIIVGAGNAGTLMAKEMIKYPEMGMLPVGFLDDNKSKLNQRIVGIPVLGKIKDMETVIYKHEIEEVIIGMAKTSGSVIREVVKRANDVNVHCRTIPPFNEVISGEVRINQLRDVQVEDLLRRNPVKLNTNKINDYIKGKTVLVTGAGGSIGSEIVRQVCTFLPQKIVLVGRGENSIHEIYKELNYEYQHLEIVPVITDVRDKTSLEFIFKTHHPEVVFHAAAHKHVYLMENNPCQAILNNVLGTKNLVDLSLEYEVSTFVNISTDKAINPTSVMGASKRVAEYIVEDASKKVENDKCFVSVRFGNVLGSRGSVIPIFKEQIKRGGPVTVTHPDMVRYFMTIPEASQLVLQAGALNMNGAVFVLDMGEPVKIVDMARDLIRLSGFEPDIDIKISYTGVKPGEKLFEELLNAEEGQNKTQHESIFVARKNSRPEDLEKLIVEMKNVADSCDQMKIRKMFKKMVPTYTGLKED